MGGAPSVVSGTAKRKSIINTSEENSDGRLRWVADSSDDENDSMPAAVRSDAASFVEDEPIAPPSAAVASSVLLFAVRGVDQKVHLLRYDANRNKFSHWETLDIIAYSGVAASSCSGCHFDLLARSAGGTLMHSACEGGAWSSWSEVPGPCASTPGTCSVAPDTLEVFAADSAGTLLWRRQNVGRWTDWRQMPVKVASSPCSVSTRYGVEIFSRSKHGTLMWLRSNASGWSEWLDLGGRVLSPPRACLGVDGRSIYVFAVGDEGRCYCTERMIDTSDWSDWYCLGGAHASAIACAAVRGTEMQAIFLMSATPEGLPQVCRCRDNIWGEWKVVPGLLMF
jgi:hypothetical protein